MLQISFNSFNASLILSQFVIKNEIRYKKTILNSNSTFEFFKHHENLRM